MIPKYYQDVTLHPRPKGPFNSSAYRAARDATYEMMRTPLDMDTSEDIVLRDWIEIEEGYPVWNHRYLALQVRQHYSTFVPWIVEDSTRVNPTEGLPFHITGTRPVGDVVFMSLADAAKQAIAMFTRSRVRTR